MSARMSKITNDGLTRSGTGCFIAVPMTTVCGRQRVKRWVTTQTDRQGKCSK